MSSRQFVLATAAQRRSTPRTAVNAGPAAELLPARRGTSEALAWGRNRCELCLPFYRSLGAVVDGHAVHDDHTGCARACSRRPAMDRVADLLAEVGSRDG